VRGSVCVPVGGAYDGGWGTRPLANGGEHGRGTAGGQCVRTVSVGFRPAGRETRALTAGPYGVPNTSPNRIASGSAAPTGSQVSVSSATTSGRPGRTMRSGSTSEPCRLNTARG